MKGTTMNKVLNIAWKDLLVIFSDWATVLLMLGAPLALTVGLGLVTGSFGSDEPSGIEQIPVAVVNQDEGQLGEALAELFQSDELAGLVTLVGAEDETAARQLVNEGEIAAAVIVPAGFSAGVLPDIQTGQSPADSPTITVYGDPGRPIGASIIESIVNEFTNQIDANVATIQVTLNQLLQSGAVSAAELPAVGQRMGEELFASGGSQPLIQVARSTGAAEPDDDFNLLSFFAPAMAVFFLMYTVTQGGRSILQERYDGTLPRMLVAPATAAQILGGKVFGIFLSGAVQVGVLILACTIFFGLRWGDPLGVLLLVVFVAAAATGWGLLIASLSTTPGQISSVGTALMLIFGILGGSFTNLQGSPLLQTLGKITPNAWAQDGFVTLATGGNTADLFIPLLALLIMAAVLFVAAALIFQRRRSVLLYS
jgi:ABC-2 type transport system permease protein